LGGEVLEIGAGIGNLTRWLSIRRRRYVATECDEKHLERLRNSVSHRPQLETALCDLTRSADFAPFLGAMDTVICLNVVEHIADDRAALENIGSALAHGGRAIILVPRSQGLYGRMDEVLGHYRRYSHASLRERMEEAGFAVELILDFNRISAPGWYLNGRILKRASISRLQLLIFDRFVWFWRTIDSWLPWGSTSIIAIGRKP
jgi:SAM-dependent methyltransferase